MNTRRLVISVELESTERIDVLKDVIRTQLANPPLTKVLQLQINVIKPEPKKGTKKCR